MLNKVIIMGRIVKDPELRYTQSNIPICSFTIACDRAIKNKDGETVTDFINCVAWRSTADFVTKFFNKGKLVTVEGQLQQRKFTTKDGEKRQVHEVIADSVYFCESKQGSQSVNLADEAAKEARTSAPSETFTEAPANDEEFPF